MKKVLIAALLTLLVLAIPMQALAVTAQYPTTQAFMDAMDQEGIKYTWRGVDEDNVETLRITYSGDYMDTIATNWFFEMDPQRVWVRVWNIITYNPLDYSRVLDTVNSLNNGYRYLTFYADTSDNTVTASFDMPIREEVAGEFCVEMLSRVVNIVDIGYNELKGYDTAGN